MPLNVPLKVPAWPTLRASFQGGNTKLKDAFCRIGNIRKPIVESRCHLQVKQPFSTQRMNADQQNFHVQGEFISQLENRQWQADVKQGDNYHPTCLRKPSTLNPHIRNSYNLQEGADRICVSIRRGGQWMKVSYRDFHKWQWGFRYEQERIVTIDR